MATAKKRTAASAKSSKKSVTKAPVHAKEKPQPKKIPHVKTQSSRKPSPVPFHTPAKKSVKNPKLAAKLKTAKPALPPLHKPIAKPTQKPTMKPVPESASLKPRFNKADLEHFKNELLGLRERIAGQSGSMRTDALQRTDEVNPEEDGTDAFMRLQALEQVSSQHLIITNINESLRAIEKGSYGVCDMCRELISKQRLTVLPFAKNCIKCQSELERPNRSVGRR